MLDLNEILNETIKIFHQEKSEIFRKYVETIKSTTADEISQKAAVRGLIKYLDTSIKRSDVFREPNAETIENINTTRVAALNAAQNSVDINETMLALQNYLSFLNIRAVSDQRAWFVDAIRQTLQRHIGKIKDKEIKASINAKFESVESTNDIRAAISESFGLLKDRLSYLKEQKEDMLTNEAKNEIDDLIDELELVQNGFNPAYILGEDETDIWTSDDYETLNKFETLFNNVKELLDEEKPYHKTLVSKEKKIFNRKTVIKRKQKDKKVKELKVRKFAFRSKKVGAPKIRKPIFTINRTPKAGKTNRPINRKLLTVVKVAGATIGIAGIIFGISVIAKGKKTNATDNTTIDNTESYSTVDETVNVPTTEPTEEVTEIDYDANINSEDVEKIHDNWASLGFDISREDIKEIIKTINGLPSKYTLNEVDNILCEILNVVSVNNEQTNTYRLILDNGEAKETMMIIESNLNAISADSTDVGSLGRVLGTEERILKGDIKIDSYLDGVKLLLIRVIQAGGSKLAQAIQNNDISGLMIDGKIYEGEEFMELVNSALDFSNYQAILPDNIK